MSSHQARFSYWIEVLVASVGALLLGLLFLGNSAKAIPVHVSRPSVVMALKLPQRDQGPALSQAHPHPAIALELMAPTRDRGQLYTIQWGQTLWGLSQRFHVTVAELEAANHLTAGSLIVAGTTLIIPALYTIKPGDSLQEVANEWGVTVGALVQENRLIGNSVKAGETLLIPYGHTPSSPPTAPPLANRGSWPNLYHLTPDALLMIARLVQAEAGNQSFVAQVAVAAVVLNRLKSPAFPKTVAGVIFSPGQFETVSAGTYWNNPGPLALLAARAAATGWDPSGGALYFYNPTLPHAGWMDSLPQTAAIGAQIFSY